MSGFVFRFAQAFLFLLPFQFALAPVSGIDLPFSRVLAPLLFLAWLSRGLATRDLRVPIGTVGGGLLIFLFFSLLSGTYAEKPDWSIRRMTFLLSYLPLFPVFSGLLTEYGRTGLRSLLSPFVAGASLAALVGLCQFAIQFAFGTPPVFHLWVETLLPFFLGPGFGEAVAEFPSLLVDLGGRTTLRASAFFPDPHILAFYMGFAFPIAAVLTRETRTPFRRTLFGISSILIVLADLLSLSRGGYIGLATGLITAFLILSERKDTMRRMLVIAISASILFLSFATDTPVRNRFLSSFSTEEGSNSGRLTLFREAAERISDHPFGYGLGNYPLAVKPTADYREPIYAHDLFLDIATESGIFAAAAFLSALLSAFFLLYRSRRDPISRAGSVSIAIFFGHALFETPLYSVHILPVLLLFLALPAASDRIKT